MKSQSINFSVCVCVCVGVCVCTGGMDYLARYLQLIKVMHIHYLSFILIVFLLYKYFFYQGDSQILHNFNYYQHRAY
jgi:hypothetical protein